MSSTLNFVRAFPTPELHSGATPIFRLRRNVPATPEKGRRPCKKRSTVLSASEMRCNAHPSRINIEDVAHSQSHRLLLTEKVWCNRLIPRVKTLRYTQKIPTGSPASLTKNLKNRALASSALAN